MYIEDVVDISLSYSIGRHTAVGAIVGLVEVLDVEIRAGDHSMRRHVLIYSQPVNLMGTGEHKYHTHHSASVYPS